MSHEMRPDEIADDGYWQSLLAEVEAADVPPMRAPVPIGLTGASSAPVDTPPVPSAVPGAPPDLPVQTVRPDLILPPTAANAASRTANGAPGIDALWEWAIAIHGRDEVVEGAVTGFNRGGLLVSVHDLPGFVPASHMVGLTRWTNDDDRAHQLGGRIGERLRLKVIELNRAQNRFILSERLAQERQKDSGSLLQRLKVGDVCPGKVNHLTDFGAFVDLGGIDGLVHVSEISWERVEHPRDLLQLGQELQVCVISIEPEKRRIQLSLKRLRPDPWAQAAGRYQIGQIVEGTVTSVTDFGAFTRTDDGLEGLIHASELTEGSPVHPENLVRVGDRVQARIMSFDAARRRLALSLRLVASH